MPPPALVDRPLPGAAGAGVGVVRRSGSPSTWTETPTGPLRQLALDTDADANGVDSRVAFMPEGPGLAALESPELAELLARYDPAYRPPLDLGGRRPDPRSPAGDLRGRPGVPVPAGRPVE
jgi:hypothetical protein